MASERDSTDSNDLGPIFDIGVLNLSDNTATRPRRRAPIIRQAFSANNSFRSSPQSDGSSSSNFDTAAQNSTKKHRKKPGFARKLPPMGIFWDIENVRVPKMKSASAVVQKIREIFLENYRESEFVVVCDVTKEHPQIVQELNDSQVNLIHVSSTSKNAADEKLRQSIRRFADIHPAPSSILLITGDINFAPDLSDLRHRKKVRVILVHNVNVADALILCANEHHLFMTLVENLPANTPKKSLDPNNAGCFLTIVNLPRNIDQGKIKNRLKFLSYNCGGKCTELNTDEGVATLKFGNSDLALRAQKRIQGEDVFGQKIRVLAPSVRSFTGQRLKNGDFQGAGAFNIPPPGFYQQQSQQPPPGFGNLYQESFRPISSNRNLEPMQLGFNRVHSISNSSEFSDSDAKAHIPPDLPNGQDNQPVELTISNLDSGMEIRTVKRLLINLIKEYVMIVHLKVVTQLDGQIQASLTLANQQDAQLVISHLQKKKLGSRRISIAYKHNNNQQDLKQLKAMAVSVLQEAPDEQMPLFKLLSTVKDRYQCNMSVADVNKIKDVVRVRCDETGGRVVGLTEEALRVTPDAQFISQTMLPNCIIHCRSDTMGWRKDNYPNILVPLSVFAPKLLTLLNIHCGSMPLVSFQCCYEQEYHEPLPESPNGVPLEHLVTCVPHVSIQLVGPNKTIKVIQHNTDKSQDNEDQVWKSIAPSLAPNMVCLCREVVELLKTNEKCQMVFKNFVPSYHHHFGKQLRVADYGYMKLLELLEAIPHVVQLMGDAYRRVITLTHSAQIRRFTSDLLRMLKGQPNRQLPMQEFHTAYEKSHHRPFNPVQYGLCTLDDLLSKLPQNTVVIDKAEGVISIPKKQQNPEEIAKTKLFIEEIREHNGERVISLTQQQSLSILGAQLVQILYKVPDSSIQLEKLAMYYYKEFGYMLDCSLYQCATLQEVIEKLSEYVQVIHSDAGSLLRLRPVEMDTLPNILSVRSWALLLCPPHVKDLTTFCHQYRQCYNGNIELDTLKSIPKIIQISSINNTEYISLTSLYVLGAQLYYVICQNNGSIPFNTLEQLYEDYFNKPLKLAHFNISSVNEFYKSFSLIFHLKGSKRNSMVVINKTLQEQIMFRYQQTQQQEESSLFPLAELNSQVLKKYSPPKPDTPPTPGSILLWNTPGKTKSMDFTINMPMASEPSPFAGLSDCLVSPARHLLTSSPWKGAPEPHELPMPDKLLPGKAIADDSGDSGVNTSPPENELSTTENKGAIKKKPFYGTYLNFK
ncbi:unnamed protein product [Ceutorhynchus assimilis]|uniref:HTH OST-type domain-containing protein n=1 Tax=Ceutorhynchus assimilis TaxID=467358 RepID=A0A9P0DFJ4_9CUCU|nr:unnamed protein product [Ceutorhynchus assimilis]